MYAATALRNLAQEDEVPDDVKAELRGIASRLEQAGGLEKAHRKAEELRKADTSLTPAKAFERAMADPEIAKAYARARP
ncbi:MAG: hypothetical protein WAU69_03065 [Solirubrobacteraceae bacterium]